MPKAKKQKFPYLLGSKWTAQNKVDGWRHFEVVNRKNQGKWVYAEMVSSCDPNVRFWTNATILQDRELWHPGWQTLEDIRAGSFATDTTDVTDVTDRLLVTDQF